MSKSTRCLTIETNPEDMLWSDSTEMSQAVIYSITGYSISVKVTKQFAWKWDTLLRLLIKGIYVVFITKYHFDEDGSHYWLFYIYVIILTKFNFFAIRLNNCPIFSCWVWKRFPLYVDLIEWSRLNTKGNKINNVDSCLVRNWVCGLLFHSMIYYNKCRSVKKRFIWKN